MTRFLEETVALFIRDASPLGAQATFDIDTPLLHAGIIDSMAILTITARLKKDLGAAIPDEMIRPEVFATLRSLVELVQCCREPTTDQLTRHRLP